MMVRATTVGALLVVIMGAAVLFADEKRATTANSGPSWLTSHADALALAKKEKKIVLADFTGSDWCGFCIKLKKEVLDTPEFKEWAGKELVLLELDFPRGKEQTDKLKQQNQKLKDEFKVRGFPTVVLMSEDGKELGRIVGFGGKESWLKQAHEIAAKK